MEGRQGCSLVLSLLGGRLVAGGRVDGDSRPGSRGCATERLDRLHRRIPRWYGAGGAAGPVAEVGDRGGPAASRPALVLDPDAGPPGPSVRVEWLGGVDRGAGRLLLGPAAPGERDSPSCDCDARSRLLGTGGPGGNRGPLAGRSSRRRSVAHHRGAGGGPGDGGISHPGAQTEGVAPEGASADLSHGLRGPGSSWHWPSCWLPST